MKLPHPFYQLPLKLDVARLQEEVNALPDEAWHAHPTGYAGNSSVRLISANGGENDDMVGDMQPTRWLKQMPYVRQVLAQLGLVWSRSRLMRLEPGAQVPPHSDVSYHWRNRMRFHMPVFTHPGVEFQCDDQAVHMEAGTVWTFDNWRPHQVNNRSDITRIHLVADTTGNSKLLNSLSDCTPEKAQQRSADDWHTMMWTGQPPAIPLRTERGVVHTIMPATEVELLTGNYLRDLPEHANNPVEANAIAQWNHLLNVLSQDWQELWSLYRDSQQGWPAYRQLRDETFAAMKQIQIPVTLRSNGIQAIQAVKSGMISYLLCSAADKPAVATAPRQSNGAGERQPLLSLRLPRPIFIVAAPRSGSTLLYETLAVSPELHTVGGEAHWLIEQFADWQPESGQVDSNRLDASTLTSQRAQAMLQSIASRLRDVQGNLVSGHASVRWLEKTPKNSLRIPLLKALFPDALFVHLWRDPEENIASIMTAWQRGNWVTYRKLPGWEGNWSLLLPPGWQSLQGRPLQDIAAHQWTVTNRVILDDLAEISPSDQLRVHYSDLCSNPAAVVQQIVDFAGLSMTPELKERCSHNLPLSRFTDTPPDNEKWRKFESEILGVLESTHPTKELLNKNNEL